MAKFINQSMKIHNLHKHRRAFYIGSILPDCTPSFFTRKHTMAESYEKLQQEIRMITEDYKKKGIGTYFFRHLGIITHYLADYCTYPHNESFDGGFIDHCSYEKKLKFALRKYFHEERDSDMDNQGVNSLEDIFSLIERIHDRYMDTVSELDVDCHYSVALCHQVVDSILQMSEQRQFACA